jgi:hypothetical protein
MMNYLVSILGPLSNLASILAIQERDKYGLTFSLCALAAVLVVFVSRMWREVHKMLLRVRAIANKTNWHETSLNPPKESPFDYLKPAN